MINATTLVIAGLLTTSPALSGTVRSQPVPGASPLAASEVVRIPAPEAGQGAAVDARHVYAINNSEIGKYARKGHHRVARWQGDPHVFRHINSCRILRKEIVCAASNYPDVPMASTIEWFDKKRMRHLRSRAIGQGRGSLTWLDWHGGSWWACFAHYDGRGGEPGRDHRATVLVRYTADFVEQDAWQFPASVLEQFAPRSASGGAWGPDGLLYVTGHDLPELYVLRLPRKDGPRLEHVATIATPTRGQAIAWDTKRRLLWSIDRAERMIVASSVPPVPAGPDS